MKLSDKTVADLVDTLRHIKKEFDRGYRIDATHMDHVDRALTRVDIELSFQRQEQFSADERAMRGRPVAA